jgi:hypothetical protein
LIFPNGFGVTAVTTARSPGGAHQMPRRRRSARLAAQLAAGHHDDVHDRHRGEEGEDRRQRGQVRDGDEGGRAEGTDNQAEARENQAEGERAARGRRAGEPGKRIVVVLAGQFLVSPWRVSPGVFLDVPVSGGRPRRSCRRLS